MNKPLEYNHYVHISTNSIEDLFIGSDSYLINIGQILCSYVYIIKIKTHLSNSPHSFLVIAVIIGFLAYTCGTYVDELYIADGIDL